MKRLSNRRSLIRRTIRSSLYITLVPHWTSKNLKMGDVFIPKTYDDYLWAETSVRFGWLKQMDNLELLMYLADKGKGGSL